MANEASNWPVGYIVKCPSCGEHTAIGELLNDGDAPYQQGGKNYFNFVCPACNTQNGISEDDTQLPPSPAPTPSQPPGAPEPAPAPEAPVPAPATV